MLQASHGMDDEGYADAPIAVNKQLVGDSGVGYGCAGGGVGGGSIEQPSSAHAGS